MKSASEGSKYPGMGSKPSAQPGINPWVIRVLMWVILAWALASALRLLLADLHVGSAAGITVRRSCKETEKSSDILISVLGSS